MCNFSLLGKESVEMLVNTVPKLLEPEACFIVQTLHPMTACGNLPYRDGWREGSWSGFGRPVPWYFRTLESWTALITASGLSLLEIREPLHPATGLPASAILLAQAI